MIEKTLASGPDFSCIDPFRKLVNPPSACLCLERTAAANAIGMIAGLVLY